jgi:hypothetical protein
MTKEEAIKLWKDNGIARCEMNFYCGGDSMGDTDFTLYNSKEEAVQCEELISYFDNEVYDHINFYECSDGHYLGESGYVYIEFEDDDFTYSKSAQAEWSESIHNELEIELTQEQADFLKKNVSNVNGGYDEFTNFNYSRNFIMTNKDEEVQKTIGELVDSKTSEFCPDTDNEIQDWFTYETEETDFVTNDNKLLITIRNEVYTYTESED